MAIEPGTTLLHYRIVEKVGEGGMGVVWRATDTDLGRDVAIKVLPAEFVEDAERLARFEREARLLASLNHPNIATVHGLHKDGSVRFLAMELVGGQDLSDRLATGPMAPSEAIAVARQIAEALEAAHDAGIVHRDLKPANVRLTEDGQVKVLDFGLAKGAAGEPADRSLSMSPTMTSAGTRVGMILGTASYMSPEQAKGQPVDRRADIWAFGVVLHEMLTGKRLFDGGSVSEVLAAVLMRDPDWSALPDGVPHVVRNLLRRCLRREPRSRLQHVGDARVVLEEVAAGAVDEPAAAGAAAAPPSPARLALLGVALVACVLAGAWIGRVLLPGSGTDGSAGFRGELEVVPPEGTDFVSGLALSPDGRRLAFVARGEDGRAHLWVRRMDSGVAEQVPGTVDARYPFWSPDGDELGFFAQNKLKVTGLLGGAPRVLADAGSSGQVRGAAWGDGRIVFAPIYIGPLFEIPAAGGAPRPATEIPEGSGIGTHRFPSFLPDGERFVFFASTGTGIEPGTLHLGRLGSTATRELGPAHSTALYADGHLIYVRGESLVAHPFDLDQEAFAGEPVPLGIALPGNVNASGQRSLSVSRDGLLVYRVDKHEANKLVWVDRRGEDLDTLAADPGTGYYWPTLSPDGRRLAVSQYVPGATGGNIFVYDLERGLSTQRTFDDGDATTTTWSPDGREIGFSSNREQDSGVYRVAASGTVEPRPLSLSKGQAMPVSWRADETGLVFLVANAVGQTSVWSDPLDGSAARRLGPDRAREDAADVSPDGRWLAFQSESSGGMEVYVRRLDDDDGTTTMRASSNGGSIPRWRSDGRELFYVDATGRMMAVPVAPGDGPDALQLGRPEELFVARLDTAPYRQYDVTRDGARFILSRTVATSQAPVSVVVGWQDRLRGER